MLTSPTLTLHLPHQDTLKALNPNKRIIFRSLENGLMTYDDGLDRISEAIEVKETKYTNIEKKISRNNASQDVPVVNEDGFDNVEHQKQVGIKAAEYRLEWKKKGCLPDDVEVVAIGEGNKEAAQKWRAALREVHNKLDVQDEDQHTYITADTDEGQVIVSQSSCGYFTPSEGIDGVDLDKDVSDARPAIYMRATKGEKTTELHRAGKGGSDWFEGFPIDQLTTAYADIKLRKIKGTIYIILDEDVERKVKCAKGKSHLYDLIRHREVGSVFMKSPNRGNEDAVEIRMMLEAKNSCNGLQFYFSEDSGKDPLLSADKEAERKILRIEALAEFKAKEAAIEKTFTATLSASDLQLHNFMKNKVVNKLLNEHFLKTVVSYQKVRKGAPSPWIVEILKEKNKKRKGSIKNVQQEEYHQPEKKQKITSKKSIKIHHKQNELTYSKTDERMIEFEKSLPPSEKKPRLADETKEFRDQLQDNTIPKDLDLITSTNNDTGYKGVKKVSRGSKPARYTVNFKEISLGTFDTLEEAAREYAKAYYVYQKNIEQEKERLISAENRNVCFKVTKPENGGLGLIFEWCLVANAARVTGLVPGSVSIMTPLTIGMILESVNGIKCNGFKHTRDLLVDATGEIKIIAKHTDLSIWG